MTLSVSKDLISPTNSSLQIAGLLAPLLLVAQGGSFDHHHQEKVAPLVIMDKSRSIQQTPFAFSDSSSAQSTSQPHPLPHQIAIPRRQNPQNRTLDRSSSIPNQHLHTHIFPQASAICCRELFARCRDGRWSLRRCDRPSFPPPARSPPSSHLSSGENTTRRSSTVRGLSSLPWPGHYANLCRDRLLPAEKCGNARQVRLLRR